MCVLRGGGASRAEWEIAERGCALNAELMSQGAHTAHHQLADCKHLCSSPAGSRDWSQFAGLGDIFHSTAALVGGGGEAGLSL